MAILTVRLSDELKKQMKSLKNVNWSQIARRAIEEKVALETAHRTKDRAKILEASESMDLLHEDVMRKYGTIDYDSSETVRLWREARYSSSYRTPQRS